MRFWNRWSQLARPRGMSGDERLTVYSLLMLTCVALVLSLAVTPLLRDWSIRFGPVDRPDGRRKLHSGAIPRSGGVPILVSYVGAFAVWLATPLSARGLIQEHTADVLRLLPPVGLIFAIGLLDDWLDLKPTHKLAGQITAAVWAFAAGVRILSIGGHDIPAWFGFLLTVGWLILCSNAFNLIDGVDGLAAGVGLTATTATLAAGLLHGDWMLGLVTAPLAGCLLGFLRYNFNPASIFLGDSGSLLIGFLLGCYGVIWSQKCITMLGMAAPAMVLALPLLEVGLSIVRRFLRNEPIFAGDRGHIHHRLLDRGLSPRRVAVSLYVVCGLGASISLVESVLRFRYAAGALVVFGVAFCLGVRYLDYAEFRATWSLWSGLRPMLGAHVELQLLESALKSSGSIEQCWSALERTARALGYSSVRARLGGGHFQTHAESAHNGAFWQMRLNLPGDDYLNITQQEGGSEQPVLVVPFIALVRNVLPPKLTEIGRQSAARKPSTRTVMSSDCAAPSVNCATLS